MASHLVQESHARVPPRNEHLSVGWHCCAAVIETLSKCCVVSLIVISSPAVAYVPTRDAEGRPIKWNDQTVTFFVESSLPPVPTRLDRDLLVAMKAAAETWNSTACAGLTIKVEQSSTTNGLSARNSRNTVVARYRNCTHHGQGEWCHDPDLMALTTVFSTADGGSAKILEADIEINAATFEWSLFPTGTGMFPGHRDLKAAVLHELGHALGFAHSCRETTDETSTDEKGNSVPICAEVSDPSRSGIMFPHRSGGRVQTDMSPEERRGLCEAYPRTLATPTKGSAARMYGGPALLVGLVSYCGIQALLRRRRRTTQL